jgi:DNA-binding GntR family transcriptional regulator
MDQIGIIEKVVLSEQIKEKIMEMILRGDIKPGDRLIESKIARGLGVSQAPVREAIKALSILKLVNVEPYKGATVSSYTKKDLYDFILVRSQLEVLAAKLAAQNITESKLAALQELVDFMRKAAEEGEFDQRSKLNSEFHEIIIEASDNSLLIELTASLRFKNWSRLTSMYTTMAADTMQQEHQIIIDCLRQHDMEGLEKIIMKHNQDIYDSLDMDISD